MKERSYFKFTFPSGIPFLQKRTEKQHLPSHPANTLPGNRPWGEQKFTRRLENSTVLAEFSEKHADFHTNRPGIPEKTTAVFALVFRLHTRHLKLF